jgi:hypothetical protein
MSNTIALTGEFQYKEGLAGGTITPGHLIEVYDDSGTKKLRVHATEGGLAERAFAIEDPLQGQTALSPESRTIDTNYVDTEQARYVLAAPGSVVQAWLEAGENVTQGDKLISSGSWTLIADGCEASGTTVRQVIGVAEETLDLSASGAVDTRIDIRVL